MAISPIGSVDASYHAFEQHVVNTFEKNGLTKPNLCCKSQLTGYLASTVAKYKLLKAVNGGLLTTLPEVGQWITQAVEEDFWHPLPSVAGLTLTQLNQLYKGMVGDYYAASGLTANMHPDLVIGLETNTNRLWMFTSGFGNDFPPNSFPILNFKKGKTW